MKRTHVFMAMSLDGFIAGPNDELELRDSRPVGGGLVQLRYAPRR